MRRAQVQRLVSYKNEAASCVHLTHRWFAPYGRPTRRPGLSSGKNCLVAPHSKYIHSELIEYALDGESEAINVKIGVPLIQSIILGTTRRDNHCR